ncbi:MAG: T9SS type A sorting domain-containing protein, partial [Bacteroidales bacterium]|nr:T9SS type A sorting domain-containing protein [Bacteroidales bacterium]
IAGAGDSTTVHPGIIDTLVIDGHFIDVEDEDSFYGDDYTITAVLERLRNADKVVVLERNYYIVTFSNLDKNHQVSFRGHEYPYPLGIESEAVTVGLGMCPNPASNNVTLNMTGVTGMVNCSIIDMSGRVIYNRTINAENSHTIDLSNVAAGAYFVRVTNDTFSKVEKLIVR